MIDLTKLRQKFLSDNTEIVAKVQEKIRLYYDAGKPALSYEPASLAKQLAEMTAEKDPEKFKALTAAYHENERIAKDDRHPVRFIHRNQKLNALTAVYAELRPLIEAGRKYSKEVRDTIKATEQLIAREFGVPSAGLPLLYPYVDNFDRDFNSLEDRIAKQHLYPPILPPFAESLMPQEGPMPRNILDMTPEELNVAHPHIRAIHASLRQQEDARIEEERHQIRGENWKRQLELERTMSPADKRRSKQLRKQGVFTNSVEDTTAPPSPSPTPTTAESHEPVSENDGESQWSEETDKTATAKAST